MRSRIVLDTRVSPDDRVHLVVRYSKNGRYRRILLKKSRWKGLRVSRRHQTAVKAHLVRNPSIGSVLLAGSPRVPSSLACAL
jgi:hypothetical protein